jgi:hypothetical protein
MARFQRKLSLIWGAPCKRCTSRHRRHLTKTHQTAIPLRFIATGDACFFDESRGLSPVNRIFLYFHRRNKLLLNDRFDTLHFVRSAVTDNLYSIPYGETFNFLTAIRTVIGGQALVVLGKLSTDPYI